MTHDGAILPAMDAPTRQALSRLERLSAVGRAASSFAHEVKGPLHIIASNAELALSHGRPDPELRASLEAILRNARQASASAQALLDFAGAAPAPQGPCDLAEAVESQRRMFDKLLVKQGVAFESAVPRGTRTAADARLVGAVLHHLLVNAAEAMPRGGTLSVSTEALGGEVFLRVRDTGPGMPPELLGKAGAPFFTTKDHGTGLGLFLVQRLLEECGGALELSSAPGRGTTASIRLPAP